MKVILKFEFFFTKKDIKMEMLPYLYDYCYTTCKKIFLQDKNRELDYFSNCHCFTCDLGRLFYFGYKKCRNKLFPEYHKKDSSPFDNIIENIIDDAPVENIIDDDIDEEFVDEEFVDDEIEDIEPVYSRRQG